MRPDSSVHWSAYKAFFVVFPFALGIVVESLWASKAVWGWLGGAGFGLGLFVTVEWWARTRLVTLAPLGRIVGVVLVMTCAGGAWHALYQMPSSRGLAPVAQASDATIALQGSVANAPEQTEEATRFTLAVDSLTGTRDSVAVNGRIRVTLQSSPWAENEKSFPEIRQGDVLRLRGSLSPPSGLRNPGGFDYAAYLARRGICCTMYVGTPDQVAVIGTRRGIVGRALVSVRAHIRGQIEQYVPSAG